jgi:phosphoribosylformylglycinamidine synthase
MVHRIEVAPRTDEFDAHGRAVLSAAIEFGVTSVGSIRSSQLYLIDSQLQSAEIQRIAEELLTDPISQVYSVADAPEKFDGTTHVEVHPKPGVMDPVAESTLIAIRQMGLEAEGVRTARAYRFWGEPSPEEWETITRRVLANDSVEQVVIGTLGAPPPPRPQEYRLDVRHVPIRRLDDDALLQLSKDGSLFLSLEEMQAIRDYYKSIEREPTDVELETLAQTWSEHCVHKTFKSDVELEIVDRDGRTTKRRYENLLASTVARATRELKKPWQLSVFVDNAGIIEFDDEYGICFKVETHNHPSAIEPYGGAATGVGGVIRDILGTGLGARPVANTDVFCFASPETDASDLPAGVLHPRRVIGGVVSGVRDYGNRMGIPTVNGAVYFDERYLGNPLVYCGCVGMIPKELVEKAPRPGDLIVVIGGRTGRDGIHGATFSSGALTHTHETEFSHAVQIGNAITEKRMLDVLLQARDYPGARLYTAITDCGAGGLSSAIGEMGAEIGAEVDLERAPLKYQGLRYDEIWISEAQERMVLAADPEHVDTLRSIFEAEDAELTVIGKFTDDKRLHLCYDGTTVGELSMDFLHDGIPSSQRQARWSYPPVKQPIDHPTVDDWGQELLSVLSNLNVASKEWIIRQYDHEVQGGSVVKPLVGPGEGPSDAAVIRPRLDSHRGAALGCGLCPRLTDLDPHFMAIAAVDEALRNVVAVGGGLGRTALLDNFCWGDCGDPEELGALTLAAQGCYDAAMAYGTPFISGKDSLHNEFKTEDGRLIRIPGTLLISALSVIEDVRRCVTMDFKAPGNSLVLIGAAPTTLAGTIYGQMRGLDDGRLDDPDLTASRVTFENLAEAIRSGKVRSCHDISDGGLAAAAAEMCIAGRLGAWIELDQLLANCDPATVLYGEGLTRFLVEADPNDAASLGGIVVGRVDDNPRLQVIGQRGLKLIDVLVDQLAEAWRKTLDW